jgi:hypothetical protein
MQLARRSSAAGSGAGSRTICADASALDKASKALDPAHARRALLDGVAQARRALLDAVLWPGRPLLDAGS